MVEDPPAAVKSGSKAPCAVRLRIVGSDAPVLVAVAHLTATELIG
jgi:hypothetical protein